jgi:hypothetical protein
MGIREKLPDLSNISYCLIDNAGNPMILVLKPVYEFKVMI